MTKERDITMKEFSILLVARNTSYKILMVMLIIFAVNNLLLLHGIGNNENELTMLNLVLFDEKEKKNLRQKRQLFPCGDWTPHGDLNNLNYDASYTTAIVDNILNIPSCPSDKNNTVVGQTIELPFHKLHCQPPNMGEKETNGGRADPLLALDLKYSSKYQEPEYSIVSPSYNSARILERTAPMLCRYTTGLWEVIFVLDGCYDDSLQVLRKILLSKDCMGDSSSLVRARIVINPTEVFETSFDNIGFLLSNPSHFVIEVQSDMMLAEYGWNYDMARPFFEYNDLFSLSGRCGHSQKGQKDSKGNNKKYSRGRCDRNVAHVDKNERKRMVNSVYVSATNNRGPLLYRIDALRTLGYYNEMKYRLGNDDHDLNRRANFRGWYASYKYVHFYSPSHFSPQRRNDTNPADGILSVKTYKENYIEFRQQQQQQQLKNTAAAETCDKTFGQFSRNIPQEPELRSLTPIKNNDKKLNEKQHILQQLPPLPKLVTIQQERIIRKVPVPQQPKVPQQLKTKVLQVVSIF